MSGLGTWIWDHDGLVVAVQLAVWAGCLAAAAPALIRVHKEQPAWLVRTLPLLAAAAAGISLFVIPSLARFSALGHEASYFDVYRGAAPPGNHHGWEPFVTYPLVRWVYWLLGTIAPGDTATVPLIFNAGVRGAGVLLAGAIGSVLGRRPEVGLAAAVLLTFHSVHAFWGGGLYNVPLPHTLGLLCIFCALVAWRSGDVRPMLAAAASGSLVVAGRVEWGLLAPALAVLLLGLGPRWGRSDGVKRMGFWVGPLALAGVYGASLFLGEGQLTEQGGYHGVRGYLVTVANQFWLVEIFEPLHHPGALLGAVGGAVAWWRRGDVGPAGPWGLLGFGLVSWLGISTFNDASYRHALLPGLSLLFGLALLAPALRGPRPAALASAALFAAVLVGEGIALKTTAERYYLSAEAFLDQHPGFDGPELDAAELEGSGCFLITDDERLWGLGLAGSHFNLMDAGEATKRWRHHGGCIYFLFDAANFRHDGLAVRVRGRKLLTWFDWDCVGWARFPQGLDAVVYRMTSPPWGITDDMPVPPTDVLMPWEIEAEREAEADPPE